MKQFIKMKHFITIMDNQGQHITLNVYAIESMRAAHESNKYVITMTSDNYHVVNGETYRHICNYLNSQNELHNLINHPHISSPNKDTTKLFDILTGEHATEVLKKEFEEICDSGEFWLWTYHTDELLDAIHNYTAKYATGYIVYDIDPHQVQYSKLLELLSKHWGLE